MDTFYFSGVVLTYVLWTLLYLGFFLYAEKRTIVGFLAQFDSFGGDDIGAGVTLLVFFYLISPWLWPALLTALLAYFSFRTLRKVIQWIKHRKDGKITPETA